MQRIGDALICALRPTKLGGVELCIFEQWREYYLAEFYAISWLQGNSSRIDRKLFYDIECSCCEILLLLMFLNYKTV